jgi:hypothetical protein
MKGNKGKKYDFSIRYHATAVKGKKMKKKINNEEDSCYSMKKPCEETGFYFQYH